MRKLILIIVSAFFALTSFGQVTNADGSYRTCYGDGPPTASTPLEKFACREYLDTTNNVKYIFVDSDDKFLNRDSLVQAGTVSVIPNHIVADSIQLDGGTGDQGLMTWNADEETADLILNGSVLQLGQETHWHVRNSTASQIDDGTVVMATGTVGASGRITIGPYDGTSEVRLVLGIATEDIGAGTDGKVANFGKVRGIQTDGVNYGEVWNEADILYTTTSGGLTNIEPATGVSLPVAFVISKHASNGTIAVRITPHDENDAINNNLNERTLVYNIDVDGVTSTDLTWIGEYRVEAAGQTGDYATDFGTNNQHAAIEVNSITGSGVVTFTGVSMSEGSGLPTATTEDVTVDATGKYQTDKKWLEITNIDIPAGITAINYDVEVLGYLDMQNSDYEIVGMRIDMQSSGVNSNIQIHIIKVQDDGSKKCSLVDIEKYGIDASTNSYVDDLRTGGDDRDYTTASALWTNGENACLKVNDYSTWFSSDENILEGSSKAEGIIIHLQGTGAGNINNVTSLTLHLTIQML